MYSKTSSGKANKLSAAVLERAVFAKAMAVMIHEVTEGTVLAVMLW